MASVNIVDAEGGDDHEPQEADVGQDKQEEKENDEKLEGDESDEDEDKTIN